MNKYDILIFDETDGNSIRGESLKRYAKDKEIIYVTTIEELLIKIKEKQQ